MPRIKEMNEEIFKFKEEICSLYCPSCPDSCCAGRLNPEIKNLKPFSELPVIRQNEIPRPCAHGISNSSASRDSFATLRAAIHPHAKAWGILADNYKDAVPEEGPFIARLGIIFKKYYLYRRCPHHKEKKCSLFGFPERPRDCILYPVYLSHPFGISFFYPFINVEKSCHIFKDEENCKKIKRLAERLNLDVIFHHR